jgi:hypothetical protein
MTREHSDMMSELEIALTMAGELKLRDRVLRIN